MPPNHINYTMNTIKNKLLIILLLCYNNHGDNMSTINVNSLDDIKGPGTYVVPYNYVTPEGKVAKFHFIVNVGNLDADSKITLAGYGGAGTNTSVDPMMTGYINSKNNTGNNGIDLVIRYNNSRSGYEPVVWEGAASQFMQKVSDKFNVSTDNTTLIGYSYSAEKSTHNYSKRQIFLAFAICRSARSKQ